MNFDEKMQQMNEAFVTMDMVGEYDEYRPMPNIALFKATGVLYEQDLFDKVLFNNEMIGFDLTLVIDGVNNNDIIVVDLGEIFPHIDEEYFSKKMFVIQNLINKFNAENIHGGDLYINDKNQVQFSLLYEPNKFDALEYLSLMDKSWEYIRKNCKELIRVLLCEEYNYHDWLENLNKNGLNYNTFKNKLKQINKFLIENDIDFLKVEDESENSITFSGQTELPLSDFFDIDPDDDEDIRFDFLLIIDEETNLIMICLGEIIEMSMGLGEEYFSNKLNKIKDLIIKSDDGIEFGSFNILNSGKVLFVAEMSNEKFNAKNYIKMLLDSVNYIFNNCKDLIRILL